jgi:hypothetical protein
VYRTCDGWIRLHTNAPHHREAALRVLESGADKASVSKAVLAWNKADLENEIVVEHGAAAQMFTPDEWVLHPQGTCVGKEPLIAWQEKSDGAPPKSFQGLKVLDLTRVLAGPVATRFLAGFGASVLRIDPPWWSEPAVEPEVTLGKRRACLDLRNTDDKQTFDRLLAQADVLIHGYRPGALAWLGYDAGRLLYLAPNAIDISLCAYGGQGHGPDDAVSTAWSR